MFTGTRGVGKTTVSRILAKSLNCTGADGLGGITATPCGACAACRDIDSGRFVDYVELDAASNRGVEEITQLLDQAVYKPVLGRFKVYMIDEVHMLSNHAFNAMLKTLEEPPEYLKFVLATTDPQKVPPTVLSRCLQFNLRPMAPQTVQSHLATVLAAEGIAAEAGALRLIARAAHGSMRDALSLADQAIAHGAGSRARGGRAPDARRRRPRPRAAAGRGPGRTRRCRRGRGRRRPARAGLSASGTLEEMAALLQQMAVAQAVPQALDRQDPQTPEVARLAGLLAPDETQLLYSIVLHGRAELGLAPDEYSGLVMVLLRLLAFAPGAGRRATPKRRQRAAGTAHGGSGALEQRGTSAAGSEPPTARSTSESRRAADEPARRRAERDRRAVRVTRRRARPSLVRTPLGDRWEQQVRALIDSGSITALARELAMQAQCVAIDGLRLDAARRARIAARARPSASGCRRRCARRWASRSRCRSSSARPTTRRLGARRPNARAASSRPSRSSTTIRSCRR